MRIPVNLGNPREITIRELASQIATLTQSAARIIFYDLPADDPRRRQSDISRATALLGWTPRIGLDKGLRRKHIQTIRSVSHRCPRPSYPSRAVECINTLAADPEFPIRIEKACIAGKAAALAVTLHREHGVYFWLLAMDPAFAFESQGKWLLAHIREEAVAAGVARIVWLRGDEAYKQAWGAVPEWSHAVRRPAHGLRERA